MENSGNLTSNSTELEKERISIIDRIIQLRRRKTQSPKNELDASQSITAEDREHVLKQALNTYRLLNEKSNGLDVKVLIEYQKGLHKIVEEVIIQ